MNITVNGQLLTVTDDALVSNSVGIYECEFTFDSSWDGFDKTSVWKLNSDDPIEVVITNGKATIPHEVLVNAGFLRIGVYGTKDEKVMPTVWLETRKVCLGTPTGSIGTAPTPSIYAQILAVATEAENVANGVKTEWESVSATAETLEPTESASVVFEDNTFKFGIPQGERGGDGADGFSPIVAVTPITNGHRVTITDAEGVHTFYVLDGTDGADGVGITNIVMNADYTLTITLSNGTSYTTPSIRGEQGEDGNGIVSIVKTATVGLVDTYTITFTDGTTTTFEVTNGAEGRSDFASYLPIDTASGTIASFTDGAEDIPVESCVVTLAPIQDTSSGDPSPTNICPISGHDEVVVRQTGKNLYPYDKIATYSYGWYSGSKALSDAVYPIKLIGGYTYALSYTNANTDAKPLMRVWRADGTILESEPSVLNARMYGAVNLFVWTEAPKYYLATSANNSNCVIISPTEDIWIDMRMQSGKGESTEVILAFGNSPQTYEPYNGNTYTSTLPNTVYGGTLDLTSGVLTINKAIVDLGTLNWTYVSSLGVFASSAPSPTAKNSFRAICSRYPYGGAYSMLTDKTIGYVYNNAVAIKDSAYNDAASLKTSLSGAQLCYELATPQTITLTPTEVTTLLGDNNIWSDNGTISVTYRADIQGYIDKKISALATL